MLVHSSVSFLAEYVLLWPVGFTCIFWFWRGLSRGGLCTFFSLSLNFCEVSGWPWLQGEIRRRGVKRCQECSPGISKLCRLRVFWGSVTTKTISFAWSFKNMGWGGGWRQNCLRNMSMFNETTVVQTKMRLKVRVSAKYLPNSHPSALCLAFRTILIRAPVQLRSKEMLSTFPF